MSTLGFNPNTPGATDSIASTQSLIQQNFQSIDSAFDNNGTGGGGNFTVYNLQSTATTFTSKPVNPVGTLYTFADGSGNPQLAWINNANAQGAGPYTGLPITGAATISANGSITLLGGIVLKWGNFSFANGVGSQSVTFGTAFPTGFYSLSLLPDTTTPSGGIGSVSFSNSSTTGFTAYRSNTGGLVTFYYIAIGH